MLWTTGSPPDKLGLSIILVYCIVTEAKEESSVEAQLPTEGSSYNMPYNDEYGIPILDLSSDTDDVSVFSYY